VAAETRKHLNLGSRLIGSSEFFRTLFRPTAACLSAALAAYAHFYLDFDGVLHYSSVWLRSGRGIYLAATGRSLFEWESILQLRQTPTAPAYPRTRYRRNVSSPAHGCGGVR
jgi:hypothetical protein